jgi:23S rRNA (uracil1939-C5)-methyltransferase
MANFFKPSSKKKSTGQVVSLHINKLDHSGTGVGKYQNKPIFIENALPQEKVSTKIIEAKGKFFKGKIVDLITSSSERVNAKCNHFNVCGGCDLQHLSFKEHLTFKQQKVVDLFSRNNITNELPWQSSIISEPFYYRRKARIGVQYDKQGDPIVGFRKKASNHLTQIKECPVLVEPIKDVFSLLKRFIPSLSLVKSIGHVEVIYTQHVSLIIRQLSPLNEHDTNLWKAIAKENQWQLYVDNGKEVNELTESTPLFYPLTSVTDKPINIYFEPKDFIQVNHDVNNKMIAQAMDWLKLEKNDIVLDLFCGLGNFSLPIASQVKSVTGVEGVQAMVEKAGSNAEKNNLTNVEFFQADLNTRWAKAAWSNHPFTKVLLDPARAGAYEAIGELLHLNIDQILYVSCDPTTLARDSQLLISKGYEIKKIAIMDMFAQTKHIETMVLFIKK